MGRRGGGFWVAVVVLVATFAAEPGPSIEFTMDAFSVVGEFGGALVVELVSGDESQALSVEGEV